jgi:hypothetical protein
LKQPKNNLNGLKAPQIAPELPEATPKRLGNAPILLKTVQNSPKKPLYSPKIPKITLKWLKTIPNQTPKQPQNNLKQPKKVPT